MAKIPSCLFPIPCVNNRGSSVNIQSAVLWGRHLSQYFQIIPCVDGRRNNVNVIDAALWGKFYRPQPFADGLITRFEGSTVIWPKGYVGHPYLVDWTFQSDPVIGFYTGTMPPGLTLTTPSNFEWRITGTPTTVGTYTLQLISTAANASGIISFQITIDPDPDEGIGGVGGG